MGLYCSKNWTGPETKGRKGYSIALFDEKYAPVSTTISSETLQELEKAFDVSSIVVDYDPAVPLESWPRPAGGFRLASINGFDLERCKSARHMLQTYVHDLYHNQVTGSINT